MNTLNRKKLEFFKLLLLFCLFLFAQTIVQAQQSIRKIDSLPLGDRSELRAIVNYSRLKKEDSLHFKKQRKLYIKNLQERKVPYEFLLPVQMQSYRKPGWRKFYIHFSPVKGVGVGFVPSDLSNYYEMEAWAAYKRFGINAPSLSVVLAQQFTESAFNPTAIGDKGKSKGLPQLYKKTAQWLIKEDKATWSGFFYFDKRGRHHFKDVQSQVRFPFLFLPLYKQYTHKTRFEGIRNYNGTGNAAEQYAKTVMARAIFYEEWFSVYRSYKLDTMQFVNSLFDAVNMHFFLRDEEMFSHEAMSQIFRNVVANYNNGINLFKDNASFAASGPEKMPLIENTSTIFEVPVSGKGYYLRVEEGRTLYSYFASVEDMFLAMNNAENKQFKLYTYKKKKKVPVTKPGEVKNEQIFSNVKPGDLIYLPSGVKIVSYGDDVVIGMIP